MRRGVTHAWKTSTEIDAYMWVSCWCLHLYVVYCLHVVVILVLYKGYRFKLKRRKSQFPSFGMCSSWSIEANGCARILRPPPVIIARSNRAYVRMMYVLLVDFMYILSVCVKVRKIRWYVLYLEEKMKKPIVPPSRPVPTTVADQKAEQVVLVIP